jgi:allophanate hydrolase subunit 2
MRLHGAPLRRAVHDELPSEGLVRGALQVTPDGRPVVMLADHPTTGGYPVLAVVHPDDVGDLAQHRPGRSVRFRLAGGSPRNAP